MTAFDPKRTFAGPAYNLTNRSILLGTLMTTERAAGLPSIVLYALPPLSLLTLYGAFLSGNAVLAPLLGILCGISMFAELIVFPACLFAFVRYPHLRSWPQAGGLALIAAHLFWTFAPLFLVIGAQLAHLQCPLLAESGHSRMRE